MEDARPRTRLLRLGGVVLVGLWAALAVAVATVYRPGGALDWLVAASVFLPTMVAAASVAGPAVTRTHRDAAILWWIWVAALLLTIPLLYAIATSLVGGGPQRLVPSIEAAYGGILALGATALFSVLGPIHARSSNAVFERGSSLLGLGAAAAITGAVAVVIGGMLVLNERTLRAEVVPFSAYGPTDPAIVPPACDEAPQLGPSARVHIEAHLLADDQPVGEARLDGRRDGRDEVWGGGWSSVPPSSVAAVAGRPHGTVAYRRVGAQAWLNETTDDPEAPGTTWLPTAPDPFGLADRDGLTLDGPARATVGGETGAIVPEDMGIEVIDGARARRCRMFVDGPAALAAFVPLHWLVAGKPTGLPAELAAWRGELDWWVFGDGELGRAAVEISGLRSDAWAAPEAIEGMLRAQLDAIAVDARAVQSAAP